MMAQCIKVLTGNFDDLSLIHSTHGVRIELPPLNFPLTFTSATWKATHPHRNTHRDICTHMCTQGKRDREKE